MPDTVTDTGTEGRGRIYDTIIETMGNTPPGPHEPTEQGSWCRNSAEAGILQSPGFGQGSHRCRHDCRLGKEG